MAGVRLAGVQVLRDINLDVRDGEFMVFVGPSGCGKTTLLRMVAGFLGPDSGDISIGGKAMNGGIDVGNRHTDELRRPVRFAGHVHQAGKRLGNEIESDLVRQRAGPPESRDREHDELRVNFAECGIIELALGHHPRAIILDHDVNGLHQVVQQRGGLRFGKIHAQALLAAIVLNVIRTAPVFHHRNGARRIAPGCLLNLDDVRPELRHHARDRRPGNVLGKVEHANALQHGHRLVGLAHF